MMSTAERISTADLIEACGSDDSNTVLQQSAGSALAMQEGNCSCNPDQLQLVLGQGTAGETDVNIPIAIKHHEVLQLLPGLSPDAAAAVAARKLDAGKVTVGKRVGAGAFSTVYQAQLEGSSSKWVVKRLDRVGADQMQQLANEIEMLTTAGNHPNLVPFKGWYKDEQGVLCLLLGHCEGGTLASLLKSRNGGSNEGLFPEDMVMCWFVQLLLALHHLHARRILHRDLKPENVLLSRNLRVAKLADFGISKQLEADIGLAVTCLGTPHYMSPEVITHRPYTFASDMWALGVVLYEMASRRPAYDARGLPQLVVKILRNAYTPLPLACSRPLQQLVGLLLRADPDDRPTTTDLLGMSIVRKHVQLLVGLAQGVHRTPAAIAAAAPAAGALATASAGAGQGGVGAVEAATDAVESGSSKSSTPRSGRSSSVTATTATAAGADTAGAAAIRPKSADASLGNPSAAAGPTPRSAAAAACEAAAATKGDVRGPLDSQCGYDDGEEVDLGGGLSVALQDMMLALRRMARAPLHVGAGVPNTPSRRSRIPAPATAAAAAAAEGGSSSEAAQQQGDRKARAGTGAATSSSRSRSNSLTDKSPAAAAAVAGSSADLSEDHAPSPASIGAPAPSAAAPASPASAAVYAALPTPLAAPNTKRPVVRTWDATAQWEAQQRKQAELRYQAKVIEQRMAREQARQRRKELDPAAAAKAAQQQQELEALQEAQRKRQQQQLAAAAADGRTGLSSMSSISAAQAAAVAAQDEQLQLLLEQLRVGSGGSSSSRFQIDGAITDGFCDVAGDDDVIEEVEEEEGLDWDQSRSNDDINQDEDYTQALALAAGDADDSSGCSEAAAVDGGEQAQVAAAGKRAWKLVVASLEGSALAAMLPKCKDTAAAAEAEDAATSDLPQLIQSSTSPTASPRSQRRSSSNAHQQQQQQRDDQGVFGHLEQELEKALAVSNEAAAQEVISSIYRMSLSMTGTARCHQRSQRPSDTSGTWGDNRSGTSGDTAVGQAGPAVMQPVGLWGKRVRPRSAADVARDEKAGAAFAMVVNQMFGNVFPESPESGRENATSGSSSSADLNRTVTGRPKSVPADALRRRSKAAEELTSTAAATLPAAAFDHHQQQQHLTSGSILDGPGSNSSSRRSSRSNSALLQQPSQPKLAYIGGLTTSRPVTTAAAAPEQLHSSSYRSNSKGALIPVWQPGKSAAAAGGGSSRVVLGGSESAQQAASATPRVDDALRILRAQDVSRKGGSSSSIHHSSANLNSSGSSSTPANAASAGARSGLVASNSRKQLNDASKHTVTGRISSSDSSSTALSKAGRSSSHSSNSSGPRAGSNSGSSKPTSAPAAGVSSKSSKASTGRPSSSSGEAGRASGATPGGGLARCSSSSSRLTKLPSLSRAASMKSISKE